jgi:hypothetical protein
LVGYAAVFDSPTDLGWFVEVVERGAFTETINQDDIRALVDHNSGRIIGRNKSGTLALSEDERGLLVDITLPDTQAGRDIRESVKRGDIDGQSFAFDTLDDAWETKDGKEYRTLTRVKLYDVGPVAFPAYPDTTVAVRSFGDHQTQTAAQADATRDPNNAPTEPGKPAAADVVAHQTDWERTQRHATAVGE